MKDSTMMIDLDELSNELLTLIEIEETRLLNWGFFDVRSDLRTRLAIFLSRLPVEQKKQWEYAQQSGTTVEMLLQNLIQRKLLFQVSIAGHVFYRTRFAETIRLLYLLRQRFSFGDWQNASRLVSDLKIQLQRRRYPKRDIEPAEIIRELADLQVSPLYLSAIACLLGDKQKTRFKLARFQKEAIIQQLRSLRSTGERAYVIGAGTGSGKTKAFYIPALAEIASNMAKEHSIKVLALYPRTELLKDQLGEAFLEARKLDTLLKQEGKRKITVGAYYSDTPVSAQRFLDSPPESWPQNSTNDGWICPFFFCPRCHSQELTWRREDLNKEVKENQKDKYGQYARLICPNPECHCKIENDQLLLTRQQMIQTPPDVFFTTTEMLNRRLNRTSEHALFGISPTIKPPRLILLDEIHTYEGTHGAQTAYLLRRWKHACSLHHQTKLCFIGLSATLTDAEFFFSKLTGVPVHQINYITPRDEDFIEEGMEYNVILKGDPVSGTSLLSTSVQTVMLLGRMLDPDNTPSGKVTYGKKIFAFTDKLDVLNRWYHIEQEAEALRTLSQYRDYTSKLDRDTQRKIYLSGQDWKTCQQIGHNLLTPLRVDLTSSQYRGVNAQANFVVATSTLEVGFNDPDVGMVIQHKAPRSIASFLQRKGRAGRRRQMRPWMVVVTSAYGRDRWAFQHTEQLFHPQLDAINLPIENYYVRKIQATYALMDWLAYVLTYEKGQLDIDIWRALSSTNRGLYDQRQTILQVIEDILRGGEYRKKFQNYLMHALDIQNKGIINSILWGEPRSLFFEVLPTLHRQIESNWQSIKNGKLEAWTDTINSNPMPDFMPPSLFADLNLPELYLYIPEQKLTRTKMHTRIGTHKDEEHPHLPITQALREFAPGHVNKRYSRKQFISEAHWLELPEEIHLREGNLPLHLIKVERSEVAKRVVIDGTAYLVYQPRTYTLGIVPDNVKNSSNGHLVWRSHFLPRQVSEHQSLAPSANAQAKPETTSQLVPQLTLAPYSSWKQIFHKIECYTQVNGHWVEITRLAIGVATETYYKKGGADVQRKLLFKDCGEAAALGFTIYADALRFEFTPLEVERVFTNPAWPTLYRQLVPEYFLYKLQQDNRLRGVQLTSFEINWLWQLELSMLMAISIAQQCTLAEAAQEIQIDRERIAERAMKVIFQSLQKEEDDDEEKVGRLHKKLMTYINNPVVQESLREHERVLWEMNDTNLGKWLRDCYASSLGAVLYTALIQLLPDINAENLLMDIEGNVVWISEDTGGGIGLISRLADAIALRPGEFDLQMADTLQHCDREHLAGQLQTIAQLIDQSDPELASTFATLREGMDIPKQLETRRALTNILEQHGIAATRDLIVALNAKFLRPNSAPDTDRLIATLVRYWHQEEQRIGCVIDLRVMAVAALHITDIKEQVVNVLKRIGEQTTKIEESQVFNLLQSLLWLNCHESCPDCIQTQQPYQDLVRPARSLLIALSGAYAQPIPYGTPQWKLQIQNAFTTEYHAQMSCEQTQIEMCKQELVAILTEPVEIGYQLYYPMIERLALTGQQWIINLQIRELMYA